MATTSLVEAPNRFLFDFRHENHISTCSGSRMFCCAQSRMRGILHAVHCWTLYPSCLPVFLNPHDMAHPAAFGTFRAISNSNYAFYPPFFLLSEKIFFPVFFLNVQVVRTDDLHRLQFFTKPALNEHNSFYLFGCLF
jgi:hypothetical protein